VIVVQIGISSGCRKVDVYLMLLILVSSANDPLKMLEC
jgi:hypothetical protein